MSAAGLLPAGSRASGSRQGAPLPSPPDPVGSGSAQRSDSAGEPEPLGPSDPPQALQEEGMEALGRRAAPAGKGRLGG